MNVLVDSTALASGHRWRGIGSYVRHLVRGLIQRIPDGARFLTLSQDRDIPPGRQVPIRSRVTARWDDLWPLYGRGVYRAVAQSRSALWEEAGERLHSAWQYPCYRVTVTEVPTLTRL